MAKKQIVEKQIEGVNVNEETGEVLEPKRRVYEMNDDSLPKWDFQKHEEFEGIYLKTKTITPEKETEKPFDMHVFLNVNDGKKYFIDSSHTITKAITTYKNEGVNFSTTVILIRFIEKSEVKGKPFNIFEIGKCDL